MRKSDLCSIPDCDRPVRGRGLCQLHYSRWKRTGDPLSEPKRRRAPKPTGPCSIPDCNEPRYAREWCWTHYENNRLRGDPLIAGVGRGGLMRGQRMWEGKPCHVKGCAQPAARHGRGWCSMHYNRWRLNGDPGPAGRLRAKRGETDYIDAHGYRVVSHPTGGAILEHRLVMEQVIGRPLRKGENVHHINGQRADNRPENLEIWVSSQPAGQRPQDLVAWAHEILSIYDGETIARLNRLKE